MAFAACRCGAAHNSAFTLTINGGGKYLQASNRRTTGSWATTPAPGWRNVSIGQNREGPSSHARGPPNEFEVTTSDRIAPRGGISITIGRGALRKHLRNCPKGQSTARLNHRGGGGDKKAALRFDGATGVSTYMASKPISESEPSFRFE
jgi:hypothetical protein